MNFKGRMLTGIRVMSFMFVFLSMILWLNAGIGIALDLSVQNVHVDKNTLTPGEEVKLSFFLNKTASIDILVYTPDYDVVRHLIIAQTRPAGVNIFLWNGKDDSGNMVPNEAYFFGITARSNDGTQAVYNPSVSSGGEITDVYIEEIQNSGKTYNVKYVVPTASRICIRAGVHNGPLLKTLLDWQPVPAGEYTLSWDGMDETGKILVMALPGNHLYIKGFSLPDNSVIVQGSTKDYLQFRKTLQQDKSKNVLTYQIVRRSIMQRIDDGISAQSLVQRSLNVAPEFTVYLDDDKSTGLADKSVTDISGETRLVVVISPDSMDAFNETRYELIVFIDNLRFDEEEHAHTPYTYALDTKKLSNGNHLITINEASINGQVGSYSFNVNVNN